MQHDEEPFADQCVFVFNYSDWFSWSSMMRPFRGKPSASLFPLVVSLLGFRVNMVPEFTNPVAEDTLHLTHGYLKGKRHALFWSCVSGLLASMLG